MVLCTRRQVGVDNTDASMLMYQQQQVALAKQYAAVQTGAVHDADMEAMLQSVLEDEQQGQLDRKPDCEHKSDKGHDHDDDDDDDW